MASPLPFRMVVPLFLPGCSIRIDTHRGAINTADSIGGTRDRLSPRAREIKTISTATVLPMKTHSRPEPKENGCL